MTTTEEVSAAGARDEESFGPYADWLRERMEERGLGVRGFARLIDPKKPDDARRALRRHLKGMVPIARTRQMYARVLGTGDDLGPAAEDVEDD